MGHRFGGRPLIKRGEVYWADFGGSVGAEIRKRRPGLVISNDVGNLHGGTVTLLPLTSSVRRVYPFEVFLRPGVCGNPVACKVRADQIRTMDKSRLGECMGLLPAPLMVQVERALLLHLGVGRP